MLRSRWGRLLAFPIAPMNRWILVVIIVAGGQLSLGCGSKTGLDVPDTGVDGGVDAGADAGIPCIDLTLDGGPIDLPLSTEAEIGRADVAFLIDTTASMQDEIDQIRDQLRDRLAPGIQAEIPDAQFAVATFEDFPLDPFGAPDDQPFQLRQRMSEDLSLVQAAVNSIELGNGRDEPESQTEALYQMATGEGLGDPFTPSNPAFIPPRLGCPSGGNGYPCFRDDALPVILLFTDAPFHNGPDGDAYPPGTFSPPPHTFAQAIRALNEFDIRVIGFDSGDGEATRDLSAAARETDAVGESGRPLVFNIGRRGERLGTQVIDAIKEFADTVIFDIDAVLVDPDPGDGVDVTGFVADVEPLSASPPDGVESIDVDANVFRGVRSGTSVLFQLRLRNDSVVPGEAPQRFRLEVVFRGDGRTRLGRRVVQLVIPGADGSGCEDNDGP